MSSRLVPPSLTAEAVVEHIMNGNSLNAMRDRIVRAAQESSESLEIAEAARRAVVVCRAVATADPRSLKRKGIYIDAVKTELDKS